MSAMKSVEPTTPEGGPIVVEFVPPPDRPKNVNKKKKVKIEPQDKKRKENLLSAEEFVNKYRREARTASWDPAILRKCGRGAEDILVSLGAERHKEKVPMRELDRRRQLIQDKEELEGAKYLTLNSVPYHTKPKKKKNRKK